MSDSDLESFVCLSKNKSSLCLYVDAIPSMDLVDSCQLPSYADRDLYRKSTAQDDITWS